MNDEINVRRNCNLIAFELGENTAKANMHAQERLETEQTAHTKKEQQLNGPQKMKYTERERKREKRLFAYLFTPF